VSAETEPQASSQPEAQRLGPEHLGACLDLDQASLAGLWTREQWQQELSQSDRLCMGLVVDQRLIAVAWGWLVVDELQIGAVAVAPDVLREARERGAANATLEVSAANTAATALYGRCGFSTAGIRRGYYRNGDDALIQWLRLQDMEAVRIAAHS